VSSEQITADEMFAALNQELLAHCGKGHCEEPFTVCL
jgi:hypothetical protein